MPNPYRFDAVKHLHTFEEKPLTGTSSIGNVLAKPLTWWASGLAVAKFGWLDPKKNPPAAVELSVAEAFDRIRVMTLSEYKKLVLGAYKAHSVRLTEAATAGTDLHAELERFVKDQMAGQVGMYDPKIQPFIDWSAKNVKCFLWSEGHCFSTEFWVGGISDCGAELNDGKIVVFDFKSSKEAYVSQFLQDAGYAIEIEENGIFDANGNLIFTLERPIDGLAIVPFGAEVIEPAFRYDVESYKRGFKSAVDLYRLMGLN